MPSTKPVDPTQADELKRPTGLPQDVGQCHAMIVSLVDQLARMQEQLDELKDRAGLNSRNSSKPLSSDGPQVGKRVRSGTGRKRGGQPGHPGAYRALVEPEELTQVVEVHPEGRCECGAQVVELQEPRRHQVFDLPERVQPEISEYRLYRGVCAGCHKAHTAKLPAGVPQGQLRPRVLGAVGVLSTQYHLTVAKVQGVLREFMGLEFSLGTISNAQGLVTQALKAPVSQAQAQVRDAAMVHLDETRYPCQGLKELRVGGSGAPGGELEHLAHAGAHRGRVAAGPGAQGGGGE